jgi:hypothetical protein
MTNIPILREQAPAAVTPTTLYTSNLGHTSTGTVFCMNRGEQNDKISIALVTAGNPVTNDCYICYQSTLHYGHSLYLQQLCLNSEEYIVVESNNGTSTFIFSGQATG